MATTARLPDGLKAQADAYAAGLGISLNALLAVALREYLDRRRGLEPSPPMTEPAPTTVQPVTLRPPKSPRAPCPCGSGRQWRHCHGGAQRAA